MTEYQPSTNSNFIPRLLCAKCGNSMRLARIEPERPSHEIRTFECPTCGHCTSIVIKY
jgi:hypothetical protein